MDRLWVAFQYNPKTRRWEPSRLYWRVYHRVGHIKAAMRIKKPKWLLIREDANFMEFHLIHYYRNPVTGDVEAHPSRQTRLIFIDLLSVAVERLPQDPNIIRLPNADQA
jgi:hypothetical protein